MDECYFLFDAKRLSSSRSILLSATALLQEAGVGAAYRYTLGLHALCKVSRLQIKFQVFQHFCHKSDSLVILSILPPTSFKYWHLLQLYHALQGPGYMLINHSREQLKLHDVLAPTLRGWLDAHRDNAYMLTVSRCYTHDIYRLLISAKCSKRESC